MTIINLAAVLAVVIVAFMYRANAKYNREKCTWTTVNEEGNAKVIIVFMRGEEIKRVIMFNYKSINIGL